MAFTDAQISMTHGAGGRATRRLIEGLFHPRLANAALDAMGDAAVVEHGATRLAFTTDSFVVRPLAFPGGSIGELAINGTLNDLAVTGARPIALTAAFVLEAGLATDVLVREVDALAHAASAAGVPVVSGDTKVVEHGKADGLYITTSGIGVVGANVKLDPQRVAPGDRVLLSGPIGDHGVTILIARAELDLESDALQSDTRSVWPMVSALLDAVGHDVKWMRDATRGGVATVLNELAADSKTCVRLRDDALPVRPVVRGACELLGLDALHVANEGQFVAIVSASAADAALAALRAAPGGADAVDIGEVASTPAGNVISETAYGGTRVVDMLVGDPLPRIC